MPIAGAFVNETSRIRERLVNSALRAVADWAQRRARHTMVPRRAI